MSTPISRNNKLEGHALYAPPRVRERIVFPDQAANGETPAQSDPEQPATEELEAAGSATEQSEIEQYETEQYEAGPSEAEQSEGEEIAAAEEADCRSETDDTDALDWVDQAIRAVIEIEHASGSPATSAPRSAAPRSPSIAPARAPARDDSAAWERPASAAPRGDRGDVRRASLRRPRLEPEIVPEPPVAMKRGAAFPLVMRFSLVVVFAAVVAYGLTMLASSQPGLPWLKGEGLKGEGLKGEGLKGAGDRVAGIAPIAPQTPQVLSPAPSPSRLVVEDQQAFANQPLSLAVSIAHAQDDESLLLGGLAQGTTLSAGMSTSPSTWRLPYDKLRGLYLYAPKDFVGVMNTSVDLIGPGKRLLDSRTMQLKWVARHREPAAPPALATATASAETTGGDHLGAVKLVTPGVEPIDPGEADVLMQKGRDSLGAGDISAARVAFRRLADAGVADAALALASTYDPDYLSAHGFLGVQGDRATARALYQRAKELGSAEANRILARMGN